MRFTSNDMSATCGFDVAWLLSYIIIVSTVYKSKLGSSVEAASERQESQPDVACRLAFSFTTYSSVFLDGEEKELIACILLTRIVITTIRRNSCVISPPPQLVSSFLVHEELNRVCCGARKFSSLQKTKEKQYETKVATEPRALPLSPLLLQGSHIFLHLKLKDFLGFYRTVYNNVWGLPTRTFKQQPLLFPLDEIYLQVFCT